MPANGETPSFIAVDFLMPYKPTSPPGRRRPVGRRLYGFCRTIGFGATLAVERGALARAGGSRLV
jgi:hypothetical protein